MDDTRELSFYEAVGGEETFRRLTRLFYEGVAADPALRSDFLNLTLLDRVPDVDRLTYREVQERRELITKNEQRKAQRNKASEEIARLKSHVAQMRDLLGTSDEARP